MTAETSHRRRFARHAVALFRMARPQMIAAGLLVYALGVIMGARAAGAVDWPAMGAGVIALLAANLCAHFADEFADRDTDALSQRTWFSGGSGVLPSGLVPADFAWRAACVAAGCALAASVTFAGLGLLGPAALGIILIGLAGGWCYSMPPLALERRGLGEVTNAVLGAMLIPLLGFATQRGTPTPEAVAGLLPVFTITLVNLLGVHWADRQADAAVGKGTLAVMLGARVRLVHHLLTALTYGLTWALAGVVLPPSVVLAVMLTLPISLWATITFTRRERDGASSAAMVALMVAACVGWWLA